MNEATYTVLRRTKYPRGTLYTVFADDAEGYADFVEAAEAGRGYGENALPGSKVDVADLKTVYRLRNDGTWEEYQSYGTVDAASETAAETALLNDLLGSDEVESDTTETEAGSV